MSRGVSVTALIFLVARDIGRGFDGTLILGACGAFSEALFYCVRGIHVWDANRARFFNGLALASGFTAAIRLERRGGTDNIVVVTSESRKKDQAGGGGLSS
ncbi:hypothetical protein CPB85DRAFT_1253906 [Mucidula mucida]|nr:hypothetical protein CPB85DRAFT_1253906 [Mucidula mucida]